MTEFGYPGATATWQVFLAVSGSAAAIMIHVLVCIAKPQYRGVSVAIIAGVMVVAGYLLWECSLLVREIRVGVGGDGRPVMRVRYALRVVDHDLTGASARYSSGTIDKKATDPVRLAQMRAANVDPAFVARSIIRYFPRAYLVITTATEEILVLAASSGVGELDDFVRRLTLVIGDIPTDSDCGATALAITGTPKAVLAGRSSLADTMSTGRLMLLGAAVGLLCVAAAFGLDFLTGPGPAKSW
ncbi:MAG: hypothetical protein WAV90_01950 [Gordonia amarae]